MRQPFGFLGASKTVSAEESEELLEILLALGMPAYILELEYENEIFTVALPLWGGGALLIQ